MSPTNPPGARPPLPYKLGRRPARHDPRTLRLAAYLDRSVLPAAPAEADWASRVGTWGVFLNDHLGCCAVAATAHQIEAWTTYAAQQPVVLPDSEIVKAYSAVGGYDPGTGANDNGCVMLDVLNFWRRTGIGGRDIYGYAAIDPKDHELVKFSLWAFGGLYLGVNLPLRASDQLQASQPWLAPVGGLYDRDVPGSWGGHAIYLARYDATGLACVTWGAAQPLSWHWLDTYAAELYAVLSPDWLTKTGAPCGLDWAQLRTDLQALGGDPGPEPPPPGPDERPPYVPNFLEMM